MLSHFRGEGISGLRLRRDCRRCPTQKEQRKEALAENDLVKAEELRNEMDEVKEKMQKVQPPVEVPQGPAPEFVEFKQRNSWYQRDDPMTRYADSVGRELFEKGTPPEKILQEIEKRTREAFPEKFRNPNRESAPEMVPSGDVLLINQVFG